MQQNDDAYDKGKQLKEAWQSKKKRMPKTGLKVSLTENNAQF